jgi:hypothetical protein
VDLHISISSIYKQGWIDAETARETTAALKPKQVKLSKLMNNETLMADRWGT